MRQLVTELSGPVLIESIVHGDHLGVFLETYRRNTSAELGLQNEFVQDNHSRSRKAVVPRMHCQPGMAKLIRCARAGPSMASRMI